MNAFKKNKQKKQTFVMNIRKNFLENPEISQGIEKKNPTQFPFKYQWQKFQENSEEIFVKTFKNTCQNSKIGTYAFFQRRSSRTENSKME